MNALYSYTYYFGAHPRYEGTKPSCIPWEQSCPRRPSSEQQFPVKYQQDPNIHHTSYWKNKRREKYKGTQKSHPNTRTWLVRQRVMHRVWWEQYELCILLVCAQNPELFSEAGVYIWETQTRKVKRSWCRFNVFSRGEFLLSEGVNLHLRFSEIWDACTVFIHHTTIFVSLLWPELPWPYRKSRSDS